MKNIKLSFVIILMYTLSPCAFAQISAYHSIVNPYKKSGLQIPAFSGYFSSVKGSSGTMSSNPASMIDAEKRSITLSGNFSHTNLKYPSRFGENANTNDFYPGSVGLLIPSSNIEPKLLLHLHINPQIFTINELGYRPEDLEGIYVKSEGKPGTISPGLVIKAMKRWSIGLSWIKWIGKTTWTVTNPDWLPSIGSDKMAIDYNGTNFQFSNYLELPLIKLGLVYYTPLTLMTYTNLSHEFQGAYEIGISSELSSNMKVAVNFYYQDNSELKNWDEEKNSYEKYTSGKELTIGMEYENLKSKILSPMFFLVKLHWLPLVEGKGDDYSGLGIEPDDMPGYELVLGSSVTISKFTALFSGYYTQRISKIWENSILPSYS